MTSYDDFTPADWDRLCDALLTSGDLVIAASPQGPLGTFKEWAVYFAEISQLLRSGTAYGLIAQLSLRMQARLEQVQQVQRLQPEEPGDYNQVRREVLERCRSATQVLMGRAAPEEIDYYKRGLLWACRQTALAAREQAGFLGIGAVPVTDEESEAIRQIAFALGLPASEAMVLAPPEAPFRPGPPGLLDACSPDEWNAICLAPLWISLAMSVATPDGMLGSAKELVTMGRGLQEAAIRQPPNSLVDLVVKQLINNKDTLQFDTPLPSPLAGASAPDQAIADGLEYCRKAVALVDQKASAADAVEYKRLLIGLARQVAEASKTGGASVSPEEQRMLDELSHLLGV